MGCYQIMLQFIARIENFSPDTLFMIKKQYNVKTIASVIYFEYQVMKFEMSRSLYIFFGLFFICFLLI